MGGGCGVGGVGRGAVGRISSLLLFQFGTAPVNCLYSLKTCLFDCFYTIVFVGGEFCSKGSTKRNDWQKNAVSEFSYQEQRLRIVTLLK